MHHDVSRSEPFARYAGGPVTLMCPCEIWSVPVLCGDLARGDGIYRQRILVDSQFERPSHGQLLIKLEPGAKVYIEKVNAMFTWSGALCHALGRTSENDGEPGLEFEYELGGFSYINRAPWERADVPDTRYVGWDGTQFAANASTSARPR